MTISSGRTAEIKHRRWAPIAVLCIGLITTIGAWLFADKVVNQQSAQRYTLETEYLRRQISDRLTTYENILLGGAGMFEGSDSVSRNDWKHYVNRLGVGSRLPGIQGVGFATLVPAARLADHIRNVRAQGFADYRIWPEDQRDYYTSTVYLEPSDGRNQNEIGYDMFSEPVRRAAMQRARDEGVVAMSGRVELLQDDGHKQAGFLMYYPVYASEMPLNTASERRLALKGYVFSAVQTETLMRGILDNDFSTISFKLYDGVVGNLATLLYDGSAELPEAPSARYQPKYVSLSTVDIGGRSLAIEFRATTAFDATQNEFLVPSIAGAGLLLSLAMYVISLMLVSTQGRVGLRTEELRKQEAFSSLLMDSFADGVIACDASGKVTLLNKTARGWRRKQVEGATRDTWETYGAYDRDAKRPLTLKELPLYRALMGEELRCLETSIVNPELPDIRYVSTSGGPLRDSQGNSAGAVLVMRDLSEKRKIAAAREKQRKFQEQILALTPNLVYTKDLQGRFVVANQAIARFYGTTEQALVGKRESDFNPHHDEVEHFSKEERLVIQTGEKRVVKEEKLTDADNAVRWLETVRQAITSDSGEVEHVLCIATDITAQRLRTQEINSLNASLERRVTERTRGLQVALEQVEEAKAEAEQANAAKSAFLATMSHEIRTPMNGVVGMVDVLAHSALDEQQNDALRTIKSSAQVLLNIIDDVLDFSKIEAGHLELERVQTPLIDLVSESCSSLMLVAEQKSVELTLHIDPQTPHRIWADPTRIRQILTNLISNAVKFSAGQADKRGRVAVSLKHSKTAPQRFCLVVEDNGIGISEDSKRILFESFRQAESSTTRRYGGSGLGLAICKRLVELMDGAIDVASVPGEGTSFTVDLPLEAVAEEDADKLIPRDSQQAIPIAANPQSATSKHSKDHSLSIAEARRLGRLILVVEDNTTNQLVILRQLELLGYTAEVAEDGAQALALWRKNDYALLLTDLHMPEIDGYELTRTIRAEEPDGVRIPILALTANAMKGEAAQAKMRGMDDYLTKPLQLETLSLALNTWLRKSPSRLVDPPATAPAPATGTGTSPIDLSILTNLIGNDQDTLAAVLLEYRDSITGIKETLHAMSMPEDFEAVENLAHQLKASSRSVGATAVGDLCAELESACSIADRTSAHRHRGQLLAQLVSLQPAITEQLSRLEAMLDTNHERSMTG